MKNFWYLVPAALFVALAVQSCAAIRGGATQGAPAPEAPPSLSLNHALHTERDILCIDCHDPEESGTPVMPTAETCFECHENLAEENESVRAYFDATRQDDGSYRFPRLPYQEGLIPGHPNHAAAEVGCAECHGEPAATSFVRPAPLELKATCMGCHETRQVSIDCAVCHVSLRKDEKPTDHDAGFLRLHGTKAPLDWREGGVSSCSQCHSVPLDCSTCHEESKPPSHREAGFLRFHGAGETDADAPYAERSCKLCHEEQSCIRCHQTMKPRSHTSSFERRLHGIVASVDRASCGTCHKTDSCDRCHQTTAPLSHRGGWSARQQTHCVACHEPLSQSSCYVCHKSTLGHLTADPLPGDGAHRSASDPSDCRECHQVLPHLDGGQRCRSCHR